MKNILILSTFFLGTFSTVWHKIDYKSQVKRDNFKVQDGVTEMAN